MERVIKFRGKRIDNGEWVYGNGVVVIDEDYVAIPQTKDVTSADYAIKLVKIVPETVGQFTGLKDKTGADIYEGDFIRFAETYLYIVKYEDAKFVGYHANNNWGKWGDLYKLAEPHFNKYAYVVIGNIYDNPELLNPASGITGVNHMIHDPKEGQEEVKAPATEEQEQAPGEATQEETEG